MALINLKGSLRSLINSSVFIAILPAAQAKPITPFDRTEFKPLSTESSNRLQHKQEASEHLVKPERCKYDYQIPDRCSIYNESNKPNKVEEFIQDSAIYAARFIPMLNNGSKYNDFIEIFKKDGQSYLIGGINNSVNKLANKKINQIPFFAYTSINLDAGTDSQTMFSFDSLMKLKESSDNLGDLNSLLFSQVKFSGSTDTDGPTTNIGLGIRQRLNDHSMLGLNSFLDYKVTSYSTAHSRVGLGGEYLWKDFEIRNNWYIAATKEKNITLKGADYKERVVPGWDIEIGYRLPEYPELAVFIRGFNWDYHNTQDNSGIESSINWQATPHINLAAWVSNEIAPYNTIRNSHLPATDEVFLGLRFKVSKQPQGFKKANYKQNIITQMTQPVRRRYDVLLERSLGGFSNRASGS